MWKVVLPKIGLRLRNQNAVILLRQKVEDSNSNEYLTEISFERDATLLIVIDILDIRSPPIQIASPSIWFRPESLLEMVNLPDHELLGWLGRFILIQIDPSTLQGLLPYQTSGAAKERSFFGREYELLRIIGGNKRGAIIVGAHKSGKTSLLYELGKRLKQQGCQIIGLLTLGWVEDYQTFFERTLEALNIDVPKKNTPETWASIIRKFDNQGKRLVFLLDEVDDLIKFDANSEYKLGKQMRSLQSDGYCEFYLAGHAQLRKAVEIEESPYRNFAEEITLKGLSETASMQLIREPMKLIGFEISNEQAHRIFEGTAGVAVLIQEFCVLLLQKLKQFTVAQIENIEIETIEQSPFNIAQRVFLSGLSVEEIQKLTKIDNLEVNSKIYQLTDGIPSLVNLSHKDQELTENNSSFFKLLQDHWNSLPFESKTLLQNLLQEAQTFPNYSLDYACPLIPEVESPWMEAFWAGFLKIEESRLTWRSEIHRKFVSVHTQNPSSTPIQIPDESMAQNSQIYILHLSDIHLGTTDQAKNYFTQLATDLTQNLKVKQLNYLVLSGDIANSSTVEEYDAAYELVDKLVKRYGLNPYRVITVPGNHDLNWDLSKKSYDFVFKSELPDSLPEGKYIDAGDAGALIRDEERYQQRFKHFSDRFYKKVYGKPYPLEYDRQAILHPCPDDKILFLALNSCWELDHHYKGRASINPNAISHAIDQILTEKYDDWLKIAIWHHPVTSAESMKNVAFLEQLAVNGFQVAMHGHIHEAKDENFRYDVNRGLRIIAAGTFGAPAKEQVTGIPLQYNLLVLNPENGELTVETRKKEKVDGAWSADARWGDKENPVKNYTIPLNYGSVKKKSDDVTSQPNNASTENSPEKPKNPQQTMFSNVSVGGNMTVGNINQIYNSGTVPQPIPTSQNPPPQRTILVLAASPTDMPGLRLDKEIREIDEGLRLAKKRDNFKLEQRLAARTEDLRRALLQYEPQIVHFCGHGETDGIFLENDAGTKQLVPKAALTNLFKLFSKRGVQCVVLNACYSDEQAEEISEHINFVVGMSRAVGDKAAIQFAVGFYDALGAGWTYEDAYELGCNAIALEGIPEELTPVLKKKSS